jgi:hypothetical protein
VKGLLISWVSTGGTWVAQGAAVLSLPHGGSG